MRQTIADLGSWLYSATAQAQQAPQPVEPAAPAVQQPKVEQPAQAVTSEEETEEEEDEDEDDGWQMPKKPVGSQSNQSGASFAQAAGNGQSE